MDITGARLSHYLLLCLLPIRLADTSTAQSIDTTTSNENMKDTNSTLDPNLDNNLTNATVAECLIDNEMGLIAIGSAGGLIVCLLVAVVTLACQVYHLQRRVYIPRSSRSNLDLVGTTEYWANAATRSETEGGLVGPCDNDVMLEEVKTQQEEQEGEIRELKNINEERFEEEEEEAATEPGLSPEEKPLMQSSTSRESYLEVPQDLEDMPLVV